MQQILGWSLSLALLVAAQPAAPETPENSVGRLAAYAAERAAAGWSGAVLVTLEGVVLLRQGHGLANVEQGVANSPETIFRIGSVTKPLVAAAALRLVHRGRLSLDDPVGEFLPSCPESWRQVRVEDLLSHTSGIPNLFGEVASGPPGDLRRLVDETLQRFPDSALDSEAGSEFAYSNFGYLLLGYIVEVAGGRPWIEVMQREVLAPAGMGETRYDDPWEIVEGRARGYQRSEGRLRNTPYKDHGGLSAGGLLSTVDDLQSFVTKLDAGELLPAELRDRMLTPIRGDYALGWQVTRFFDRPVINHTGGIGGFAAHIAHYPDENLFVAVLSNVEDEPVKAMACDLAALVLGEQPVLGQTMAVADPSSWARATGSYLGQDGETRTISRRGDQLILQRGSVSVPLLPLSHRRFAVEGQPGMVVEMEREEIGVAESLTLRSCGRVLLTARRHETR